MSKPFIAAVPDPIAVDFEGFACPVYDPHQAAKGYGVGGIYTSVAGDDVYIMLVTESGEKLVAGLTDEQLHTLCSDIALKLIARGHDVAPLPVRVLQ